MERSELKTLERMSPCLASGIILTDNILAKLLSNGVLDLPLTELIQAEATNSKQVMKFLQIMPSRRPGTFQTFLAVLAEDYPWLAEDLTREHGKILEEEEVRQTTVSQPTQRQKHQDTGLAGGINTSMADVQRMVATKIHELFGNSRRIPETEKRKLERWLSKEIWRARCEAVAEMGANSPVPLLRETTNASQEAVEENGLSGAAQRKLFQIYLRIESSLNLSETTNLTPKDLTWEVFNKMVINLLDKVNALEEEGACCLDYLRTAGLATQGAQVPVSQHIKTLVQQHEDLTAENKEMKARSERQTLELRKAMDQIRGLRADVALRQEECRQQAMETAQLRTSRDSLEERCRELEQSKAQALQRERTIEQLKQRVCQLEQAREDLAMRRVLAPLQLNGSNQWRQGTTRLSSDTARKRQHSKARKSKKNRS